MKFIVAPSSKFLYWKMFPTVCSRGKLMGSAVHCEAIWGSIKTYLTSTVFELQKWFLHQNGVEFCNKCNANLINVCAQCGQTGRNADKIPHHTSKLNYVRMVLHCAVQC